MRPTGCHLLLFDLGDRAEDEDRIRRCRVCGFEVPKGRRHHCSDRCQKVFSRRAQDAAWWRVYRSRRPARRDYQREYMREYRRMGPKRARRKRALEREGAA